MPIQLRYSYTAGVILLTVLALLPLTFACSTSKFDSTYDAYADCAAQCLACTDADYTNNFGNNCDFESGECCTSHYHSVIAETWACVRDACGADGANDAFATFVGHCEDKGKAIAKEDIPSGYDEKGKGTNGGSGSKLNKGQITGICIGVLAALVSIAVSVYKCHHYYEKKRNPSNPEGGMAVIHASGNRPFNMGAIVDAFQTTTGDMSATFTRNTSTSSFLHGNTKTEEVFEIRRQGGNITSSRRFESSSRILEVTDDAD